MDNLLNYYVHSTISNKCVCTANIMNCFDKDCNDCIHRDFIYSYCPFIQIITNESNKLNRFDLRKNYYVNTDGNTHNFNIMRNFLSRWGELSKNYNKKTSIIISLSLYNIVINNKIIIECMYYIYEPFIKDIIKLLKLVLESSEYMNILTEIFEKYFTNTPNENISIMYNWLNILEEITDFNIKSDLFFYN